MPVSVQPALPFTIAIFTLLFGANSKLNANITTSSPSDTLTNKGEIDGSVQLGVNLKKGLNSQEDWRAGTKLQHKKPGYTFGFSSKLSQQSINDIITKNEYELQVDIVTEISGNLAIENLVRTKQDKFRLIEQRSALGSGFRYKWIDNDKLQVFSGLSAIWESRKIEITNKNEHSWRIDAKTNIEWRITDTATFIGLIDYESEFDDSSDFNASVNIALRSSLSSRVGLTLQYEVEQDDVESLNFKEKQTEISTLIDYKF